LEATVTTDPDPAAEFESSDRLELDELFRDVPPLSSPHDWAAPEVFPDDEEFEEFLASYRADRARDLA
jgi:hypothetical protein